MKKRSIENFLFWMLFFATLIILGSGSLLGFVGDNLNQISKLESDFFSQSYGYLRPIYGLTLWLNKITVGLHPFGYHFFNVLLHFFNSFLVYALLKLTNPQSTFNKWLALLFMTMPIHAMNIFWISGRTDMICAFFYILSFIFFLRFSKSGTRRLLIYSIMFFIAALLSKEMAVSLPIILLLWIIISPSEKIQLRKITAVIPYFVILAFYILLRFLSLHDESIANPFHSNMNILAWGKNLAAYSGLLIIPGGHMDIGIYLRSHPLAFLILSMASLIISFIILIRFRHNRYFVFSIIALFISFLPVIRLMMRWYLYIPSIFFILSFGLLINQIKKHKTSTTYGLIFYVALSVFFMGVEFRKWHMADKLASAFRENIARTVAENNFEAVNVLYNISEYQETPVLIFGLETSVNFELIPHPDSLENRKIFGLAHVALGNRDDISNLKWNHPDSSTYFLSLRNSSSYFDFPKAAAFVSGRKILRPGDSLQYRFADYIIQSTNKQHKADSLKIIVKNRFPVIIPYFLGTPLND